MAEAAYSRRCMLQDMTTAVDGLVKRAQTVDAITDEDTFLQLLCATMERVFLHGFQGVPEGIFGTLCGYDKYIKQLTKFYPDADAAVSAVWSISKIKTANGRGRAFVKFALIEKKLDLYMLALVHNVQHTMTYFVEGSFLLSLDDCNHMVQLLFKLRAVNFSLFLKDSDTSIDQERGALAFVGVRTGKLIKTDADLIISECSWCFQRSTHGLLSEDMQQLFRCQSCQERTMICINHCGAMARCLPQRKLQDAVCAACADEIHGWKPTATPVPASTGKGDGKLSTTAASAAAGATKKSKSSRARPATAIIDPASPGGSSPSLPPQPALGYTGANGLSATKPASGAEPVVANGSPPPSTNGSPPLPKADSLDALDAVRSEASIATADLSQATELAQPEKPDQVAAATSDFSLQPQQDTNPASPRPISAASPRVVAGNSVVQAVPPLQGSPLVRLLQGDGEAVAAAAPPLIARVPSTDPGRVAFRSRFTASGDSSTFPDPADSSVSGSFTDPAPALEEDAGVKPVAQIFEGLFRVADNDDDETALLKRKILQRIQKAEAPAQPDLPPLQIDAVPTASVRSPPSSPSKSTQRGDVTSPSVSTAPQVPPSEIIVTRDHWMPDDKADTCSINGCGESFTIFNRRHHCRRCGDVVCDRHSRRTLKLNALAVPDPNGVECRVCDDCYTSHHIQMIAADPINESVPMPIGSTSTLPGRAMSDADRDRTSSYERSSSVQSTDRGVNGTSRPPPPTWSAPSFDRVPFELAVRPKRVPELCGACGTVLPKGFMATVRYCEALGIYCCSSCHSGGKTIVPAQVLRNWNFTPLEVCDRMRDFLGSLVEEPLYNIDTINPGLYKNVSKLRTMKGLREQLGHLQSFLLTCTASKSEKLSRLMPMVTVFDPFRYSMRELIEVNDGTLVDYLTAVNKEMIGHVFECELCKAKGYLCEICKSPQPFYSFQTQIAQQCPDCRGFFHADCRQFQRECPRCARRRRYSSTSTS